MQIQILAKTCTNKYFVIFNLQLKTGWNFPPVLKIVTHCARGVEISHFVNDAKHPCDQCSIFSMAQ